MTGSESIAQRVALVVATSVYDDDGLSRLVSPAQDAAALTSALADPDIGGFTVSSTLDAASGDICQTHRGLHCRSRPW